MQIEFLLWIVKDGARECRESVHSNPFLIWCKSPGNTGEGEVSVRRKDDIDLKHRFIQDSFPQEYNRN